MTTSRITNIKELRDDLLDAYAMLKADPKRHAQVGELANAAGKVLAGVKLELEYAQARGETPSIDFLEYGQQRQLDLPKEIKRLNADVA